jgi:uncharacterized peroxidase-related enzyme
MPRFPLTQDSDAPKEVRKFYRDFLRKMELPDVPNFIRTQGASPSMLAGTWGLMEHVLLEGCLPRPTKELIFLAVAADRECNYCKEAHAACCRMLGVDDSTIRAVREGLKGNIPDHIRDILLFAIKCAAAPEELNDEDFDSLTRHGLDREQTLELIATSAMAVYATIIADATMLETDAMFAKM